MKKSWKPVFRIGAFVTIMVSSIFSLYPLIWVILQSFKTEQQFLQNIWSLPTNLHLDNYLIAFQRGNLLQYFKNSVVVTVSTVIVEIIFIIMAAFAFSKLKMKFKRFFFNFILLNMLIPAPVILIPMYMQVINLKIQNTLPALIFPYFQGMAPIGLILVGGYMDNIPNEIIEAARVDGAKTINILLKIVLPISKPIIVTYGILCGMGAWNEYLWAMVSISDNTKRTLSVGISNLRDQTSSIGYTPVFAALTISAMVFVILYLCMQRTFVRSVTAGAVKG